MDPTASPVPRRLLLTGLLASYSFSIFNLPTAWATGDSKTDTTPMPEAFVKVSQWLTGRSTLDMAQAERLHTALLAQDGTFDTQLALLAAFIAQKNPDLATLQAALDTEKARFATLPASILTAWYVGVVGSGVAARCVTYEASLMSLAVADRLKPPSYAYGPYGSWSRNPLAIP
ncbi:sugar dehydrogenase complex small subunit [Rhodoferax sp.]|uniref:sugar dehydrogenase complex small subunit n=1 Tax=Rhodoferax sp. TaxID=50421 RepID=UPI0026004E3B|nr:sugar dehydrogenase complex small subunit [Rhodoferax sp.]